MIPHLRLASWNRVAGAGSKKRRAQQFDSTPVRTMGQLSTAVIRGAGRAENPAGPDPLARISNWESHPIYAIDVCASLRALWATSRSGSR